MIIYERSSLNMQTLEVCSRSQVPVQEHARSPPSATAACKHPSYTRIYCCKQTMMMCGWKQLHGQGAWWHHSQELREMSGVKTSETLGPCMSRCQHGDLDTAPETANNP